MLIVQAKDLIIESNEKIGWNTSETKDEIEKYGLSVCRNAFGMRQAVDFAGEQKFMKSAKAARSDFLYIFL